MGGDHQDHAVHQAGDHAIVLHRHQGRGVEDHEVVVAPRLVEQLRHAGRLEHLVRARRRLARHHHAQVERGQGLDDVGQAEAGIENPMDETERVRVAEAEERADGRAAEIRLDQQHPRIRRLGQGAGQVDRGRGLAVTATGARDRDDRHVLGPALLLDHVAQGAVLFRFQARRRHETHQMIVHRLGGPDRPPSAR